MSEEKKEPTAAEKMQAEYNRLCPLVGYHRHLARTNAKVAEDLEEQIDKLAKKAQNLPKEQIESLKPEEKKEEQNVAAS